jgi:uncharacterized membrane protein YgcG
MQSVFLLVGLAAALLLIASAFTGRRRQRDSGFDIPTVLADAGATEGDQSWELTGQDPDASEGFSGGGGDFGGAGASGEWDVGDIVDSISSG